MLKTEPIFILQTPAIPKLTTQLDTFRYCCPLCITSFEKKQAPQLEQALYTNKILRTVLHWILSHWGFEIQALTKHGAK